MLPQAIAFSSTEGRTLFAEAHAAGTMNGFFKLIEQFSTQDEPAYCGLSSLAMTLNALSIDPRRPWKGVWRWFHEELLDCCKPLVEVQKDGVTLSQAACLARCNGARVELHRHGTFTLDQFRQQLRSACESGEEHVVVSYSRAAFLQTGDGHFSPVGGFHEDKDLALILDVARFKYPPHWVSVAQLYEAMSAIDKDTGLPRGFMRLSQRTTVESVAFSLDISSANWEQADAFMRFAAPTLLQTLAAQRPASDISQTVSHLLSAAPLESADAYILLRSQFLSNEAKPRCLHCNEEGASCACGRASGQLIMEMAVSRNLANARASSPQAGSGSGSLCSYPATTGSACCPPASTLLSSSRSDIVSGSSNSSLFSSSDDTHSRSNETNSSSDTSISKSSSIADSKSDRAPHVAADPVHVPLSQPSPTERTPCSTAADRATPIPSTASMQSMCSEPTNATPHLRNSCCDNLDDAAYAANTHTTTFLPPTAQALVLDELCSLPLYQLVLAQLTASRAASEPRVPSQALQDTHARTHPGSVSTPQPHTTPGSSLSSGGPGPAGVRTGPDSSEGIVSSILNATAQGTVKRQISLQVLAAKATLLLLIVPGDAWSASQSADDESPSESPSESPPQPIRSSHVHNDECGNDCGGSSGSGGSSGGSRVVDVSRSAASHAMILRWRHALDLSSASMLAGEVQYLREQFAHLASLQHAPKPCLVIPAGMANTAPVAKPKFIPPPQEAVNPRVASFV
ncbi:MAG: hypothetical protein WDW38_007597 [Sanguina aurantia]